MTMTIHDDETPKLYKDVRQLIMEFHPGFYPGWCPCERFVRKLESVSFGEGWNEPKAKRITDKLAVSWFKEGMHWGDRLFGLNDITKIILSQKPYLEDIQRTGGN
jgi:hypothetical protein